MKDLHEDDDADVDVDISSSHGGVPDDGQDSFLFASPLYGESSLLDYEDDRFSSYPPVNQTDLNQS